MAGVFDLTAADEGRHPSGAEELWGESWYLDWAAPDASYGGYVRLGLYPNLGLSWWWIALVGADQPLVLVVDHELPCPDGDAALAPTAGPTSVELSVLEPLQRFRVVSAAVGVELADPAQAFHGLDGPSVPVRLDLEWASRSEAFPYAMTTRYEISSWVTGTVTIGDTTIAVDCAGQRDHSWGVRDWWQFPWNWTSGHLDDGSFLHAARSIIPDLDLFATGYTVSPGGELTPAEIVENQVDIDAEKLPDLGSPADRTGRVHHRAGRPRADPAGRTRRARDPLPARDVPLHHRGRPRRHRAGPSTTGPPASPPDPRFSERSTAPGAVQRAENGLVGAVRGDGVEVGVLLAGVDPVLELDDADLGEAVAQPAVGRVEQTELLAVRHDLREQHLLEDLLRGRVRPRRACVRTALGSTPIRSQTSACMKRCWSRHAASNTNSWRSRSSGVRRARA